LPAAEATAAAIQLARLPEAFEGFRIAQITDIHFGPYMDEPGLERAVRLAQEFRSFDFLSPWEGTDYVLPGDEKAKG